MKTNEWSFMEDPEWEARRAELIVGINQMRPKLITLRDGDELRIEVALPGQAEIVHSITRQSFMEFRGLLDPPNGSDIETPEDVARQMLKGGTLIGYVACSPAASLRITLNSDHLYIGRVGVVPSMRNRGIGRALILHAEQIAARLQLSEVRLGTREKLSDNVALYLRLGYTIDRVIPHPRGSDNVLLFVKRVVT